jgi:hypothetical protein
MGPRVLTYHGDVSHLMGEFFTCPRFMLNGAIRMVRWVVTYVDFNTVTKVSYVELDVAA